MPGPDFGYRNRMDFSVLQGRPALKEWRSRELVALDECLLLAAPLTDVFTRLGDLERARSLTLRLGESSGEVLAILTGPVPRSADTWGVPVVRPDGRQVHGRRAHVTETVANARFRVTGNAFFQNNSHGAGALVALVDEMLGLDRSDRLLDGYSGVGLFACTAGQAAGSVICVESDERALGDLQANLEDNAVPAPDIVVAPFEEVADESWTAAVVDPPRTGLRRQGVDSVTGPLPRAIVYVSCDPASLARDTRYLAEKGYGLRRVVPVDLFPQTYHLESVALFEIVSSQIQSGP